MDEIAKWLLTQGSTVSTVGVLCVIVYFGGKYLRIVLDRASAREDARELRYNALVDKMLDIQGNQVNSVTTAIVGNTAVLERVVRKLDE